MIEIKLFRLGHAQGSSVLRSLRIDLRVHRGGQAINHTHLRRISNIFYAFDIYIESSD